MIKKIYNDLKINNNYKTKFLLYLFRLDWVQKRFLKLSKKLPA